MGHTFTEQLLKDPYWGYLVLSRDTSSGALALIGGYATQAAAKTAVLAQTPMATIEYLIVKYDILSVMLDTVV
jgi:hypothetical protein